MREFGPCLHDVLAGFVAEQVNRWSANATLEDEIAPVASRVAQHLPAVGGADERTAARALRWRGLVLLDVDVMGARDGCFQRLYVALAEPCQLFLLGYKATCQLPRRVTHVRKVARP